MWHELNYIDISEAGDISTEVRVLPVSQWFSGHFPGEPILPGIAQLGIVYDTVCWARKRHFNLAGFSRVKFKKIIRPQDCLKITVAPKADKEGVFTFRIVVDRDIACSGSMTLKEREGLQEPRTLPNIQEQGVHTNEQH
jgi:3-hydroxymyristoyl/3-hydroxydecanoyl-(acyl carrier protein) dehydratase